MATRTACVIAGCSPDQVLRIVRSPKISVQPNKLGTLVTGCPGDFVIDYAAVLPGPIYDIMYSSRTGWFAVTVYRGLDQTMRWDNRPGTNPGYPRADDILGATSPTAILDVLDVPASALGYAPA